MSEECIRIKSDRVFYPKVVRAGDYMVPDLLAFLQASFFFAFNFTRSGAFGFNNEFAA